MIHIKTTYFEWISAYFYENKKIYVQIMVE